MAEPQKIEPFRDPGEYREAERKVLFPETHTRKIRFGPEIELNLRPVPARRQEQIETSLRRILVRVQQSPNDEMIARNPKYEILAEACMALVEFYKIPNVDKDWLLDNLEDADMEAILEAQIEVANENSSFRKGVRPLLRFVQAAADGIVQMIDEELGKIFSGGNPTSSPASAELGASLSTSSSADTPTDN